MVKKDFPELKIAAHYSRYKYDHAQEAHFEKQMNEINLLDCLPFRSCGSSLQLVTASATFSISACFVRNVTDLTATI